MYIDPIGPVTRDDDWYYSQPLQIPALGSATAQFVIEGYDEDPSPAEFAECISNFMALTPAALRAVEDDLYRYYRDMNDELWLPGDKEYLSIDSPSDIWPHIRLGSEPMVSRRPYRDKLIYISLECGCDWEIEHGLQIVFKQGLAVNKIGPCDGHLTTSDAYDDPELENVIYKSR